VGDGLGRDVEILRHPLPSFELDSFPELHVAGEDALHPGPVGHEGDAYPVPCAGDEAVVPENHLLPEGHGRVEFGAHVGIGVVVSRQKVGLLPVLPAVVEGHTDKVVLCVKKGSEEEEGQCQSAQCSFHGTFPRQEKKLSDP